MAGMEEGMETVKPQIFDLAFLGHIMPAVIQLNGCTLRFESHEQAQSTYALLLALRDHCKEYDALLQKRKQR